MVSTLEQRRLAVAAALRAVMTEPLPEPTPPEDVDFEPAVANLTFRRDPTADAPRRPSLRQALVAEIDWDEPENAEPLDDLDRTPDDLSALADFDDDWISPSVPPLESAGSMSRAASVALFGHA